MHQIFAYFLCLLKSFAVVSYCHMASQVCQISFLGLSMGNLVDKRVGSAKLQLLYLAHTDTIIVHQHSWIQLIFTFLRCPRKQDFNYHIVGRGYGEGGGETSGWIAWHQKQSVALFLLCELVSHSYGILRF